jgi:membrane fusion protein, copper/silver efflux system
MKKLVYAAILFVLLAITFRTGYWYSQHVFNEKGSSSGRKILYYIDPMNPAYKSDKPGVAPGCGMPLEPVYADSQSPAGSIADTQGSMPVGTVRISPEKQQLIGIKVATVEKAPFNHTLRVSGKVVPDELRIYRLNAALEGWVRKVYPATTGMFVKKDQLLATVYSPEYYSAVQAFIYTLGSIDRRTTNGTETADQSFRSNVTVQNNMNSLRNMGMSDHQLNEIARTRQDTENIEVRAPASGFVIVRNITLGQRYERGFEFYRIADLSHVWIMADVFENEASFYKPGKLVQVEVPQQDKTFYARVSNVLPLYDPASHTLKVRLEADNPGYILRPDMFVDVQLSIHDPSMLSVPIEALLDTGVNKTVFVDRGNGFFEPRRVETGRYFEDRVEIVKGLLPGERIVVSGKFLIDSESRMKAAAETPGINAIDPSCGMALDQKKAQVTGKTSTYRGNIYYFCSDECKLKFDKEPQRYITKQPEGEMPRHDSKGGHHQ